MMLDIARKTPESVSHTIVSGTAFNGTDAIPVIAQAPGYLPSPWGSDEAIFERLVLDNQFHANMLAGRVVANANREIVDVNVPLAGNWLPALDIAPQNWVHMNIQPEDNKRGISLEGYYHLRNITSEINVKGGISLADITLVPEAFGPDGVPGPYPDDWPWPTFPLPDFPEFPPWGFPRWDTLMVRNEYNDGVLNCTPYQGTVINDPSSILPAKLGDEVSNLLAYSEYDHPVEFVSDGISIFFHQYDGLWDGDPNAYAYRVYRHDIATGASDYLLFPYDDGNAWPIGLTCVDIGVVALLVWTWLGGDDIFIMYEVNFNTGVVQIAYSYESDDLITLNYFYTVQSTVNVYTIFGTGMNSVGQPYYTVTHRYNWTTGESDATVTWVNPDTIKSGGSWGGGGAPVIAGYEIYSCIELNATSPRAKAYICYYNFVTGEYGSTLLFHTGLSFPAQLAFVQFGYYPDLHRIYFGIWETFPHNNYYLAYISTLTKEVDYIETLSDFDEIWKMIGNKNVCRVLDYYDPPTVKIEDPHTGNVEILGSLSYDYGAYYYYTPPTWSAQMDDMDGRVWSFQGHYLIGQGDDDVIIAETGITPPSGPDFQYVVVYVFVLGRTFVVCFTDWNTFYRYYYVVHYPGSLVT